MITSWIYILPLLITLIGLRVLYNFDDDKPVIKTNGDAFYMGIFIILTFLPITNLFTAVLVVVGLLVHLDHSGWWEKPFRKPKD